MTEPIHVKRDGTVLHGTTPIGRVVREINDRWSPTEVNGDYLGITDYKRQRDAVSALFRWWASPPCAPHALASTSEWIILDSEGQEVERWDHAPDEHQRIGLHVAGWSWRRA